MVDRVATTDIVHNFTLSNGIHQSCFGEIEKQRCSNEHDTHCLARRTTSFKPQHILTCILKCKRQRNWSSLHTKSDVDVTVILDQTNKLTFEVFFPKVPFRDKCGCFCGSHFQRCGCGEESC